MELTKAEKDKRKLKDGYIYVCKKVLESDISSWQCILRRRVGQSRATVQISPTDEFAEKVNNQAHAPSLTQVEVTKIKVGMKCKEKTTKETVQQILGEQLSNISENAAETFALDSNDETKHPEITGRWQHFTDSSKSWGYSRTCKRIPDNQI